jgi:hypothetical protein
VHEAENNATITVRVAGTSAIRRGARAMASPSAWDLRTLSDLE